MRYVLAIAFGLTLVVLGGALAGTELANNGSEQSLRMLASGLAGTYAAPGVEPARSVGAYVQAVPAATAMRSGTRP